MYRLTLEEEPLCASTMVPTLPEGLAFPTVAQFEDRGKALLALLGRLCLEATTFTVCSNIATEVRRLSKVGVESGT